MILDGVTGTSVRTPFQGVGFLSNEGEPNTSPRSLNNWPSTTFAWKISSPRWNRPMAAITSLNHNNLPSPPARLIPGRAPGPKGSVQSLNPQLSTCRGTECRNFGLRL